VKIFAKITRILCFRENKNNSFKLPRTFIPALLIFSRTVEISFQKYFHKYGLFVSHVSDKFCLFSKKYDEKSTFLNIRIFLQGECRKNAKTTIFVLTLAQIACKRDTQGELSERTDSLTVQTLFAHST